MRKKIFSLLIIGCMLLLTGCGEEMTPRDAVRDYLEKYITLDSSVMSQLDDYLDEEELTSEQKDIYRDVLKKEYSSMTYTINNESIEDDIAYVDVKINVIDLYKVQRDSLTYFDNNKDEFNDEDGVYDKAKFLSYKLTQMKEATETTSYDIKFKVVKNNKDWEVSQLSNEDLEKIHGIYNYEE